MSTRRRLERKERKRQEKMEKGWDETFRLFLERHKVAIRQHLNERVPRTSAFCEALDRKSQPLTKPPKAWS